MLRLRVRVAECHVTCEVCKRLVQAIKRISKDCHSGAEVHAFRFIRPNADRLDQK